MQREHDDALVSNLVSSTKRLVLFLQQLFAVNGVPNVFMCGSVHCILPQANR